MDTKVRGNMGQWLRKHKREKLARARQAAAEANEPDWEGCCSNCGASPIVKETGMCGPCTFGEADTAGGNW
jgi:hypothetical protein